MKTKQLAYTLIVLGLAIATRPMHGQTISYFRQFSTPGIAAAITVTADASGIYVFGNRTAPPGGQATGGIRKYDSRGNELWTREFTVPQSYVSLWKAAVDATGVYVLVFQGSEPVAWLRKYNSEGAELWTRQLDFPSTRGVLAADGTGIYVAGGSGAGTWGGPGSISYLRKYSTDGAELWTSRFDASLGGVEGLAADATGVYLLSMHGSGGPPVRLSGVLVRKLDARGNELWAKEVNSSAVPRAFAAADPTGFYLVAVDAWGTGNFLRRYDSAGNESWSRKVDPLDFATIATDANGVYLAGQVQVEYSPDRRFPALPGQCRSGSGRDSFVRKYDPEGAEVWTRQFGTSDSAWATGVAVHPSGVYVVGQVLTALWDEWESFVPFEGFEPASLGAFLAKFETATAPVGGGAPRIFPDCVVNAASYVGGGVAPGEIVTIFGSAMGPSELVPLRLTDDRRLATALADTRVLFDGVPAPLIHVSDKQVTAIVPYAVAGRSSVEVQVEYRGVRSEAVTMAVLHSRPGIFTLDGTGQGQGAILNEDGSVNSAANPARRGSVISIFATGGGEAAPGVLDGQLVGDVRPRTSSPVSVFFDLGNNEHEVQQKKGEVLFAGGVPGSVAGLLQLNVRVPADAVDTGSAVPFALFIGSHWTVFQVTVALR